MPFVVAHAKFLRDQVGYARAGPQRGFITQALWTLEQQGLQALTVFLAQARLAARPCVNVQSFHWQALPVSFYRILIHRYAAPGQSVTHVFSVSGNSGIAAMQLARTPILIDLHYQTQTQARLNRKLYSLK